MEIEWGERLFAELSTVELYELLKLRTDVFVVEQRCPYPELDGIDTQDHVVHVLGKSGGRVVAYGRVYGDNPVHIGRIVLSKEFRGTGEGARLIDRLLQVAKRVCNTIEIQAQAYLQNWYGKVGFKPISEVYPEDGIPHVDMRLSVTD